MVSKSLIADLPDFHSRNGSAEKKCIVVLGSILQGPNEYRVSSNSDLSGWHLMVAIGNLIPTSFLISMFAVKIYLP